MNQAENLYSASVASHSCTFITLFSFSYLYFMLKQTANLFLLIAVAITFSCKSNGKGNNSSDKPVSDTTANIKTADTCNIDLPKPKDYVTDLTGLFTPEQIIMLDSIISSHEKETTNQIAIATVDSATVGNCSIIDFAKALGDKWGVGQKDKNNGTVIAICPGIHKIAIANGKGLHISDDETKAIINDVIIPELKKDNYFEGTRKGLLAIIEKTK